MLVCPDTSNLKPFLEAGQTLPTFEPAGPRSTIFFAPEDLTCGIVTCGGLCPGQNNVIHSIVLTLTYAYGVRRIVGFRYGYAGLSSSSGFEPFLLTPEVAVARRKQLDPKGEIWQRVLEATGQPEFHPLFAVCSTWYRPQ